jgi:L-malate glycosyltransferase
VSADGEISVLFVAATLAVSGGAERQLVDLATSLGPRFRNTIVCTKESGPLAKTAQSAGVDVIDLAFSNGRDPRILARLSEVIKERRPDIVHCTNFNSTAWGRAAAIVNGVPGIVTAEHSTTRTRAFERFAVPACNRVFGGRTDAIVACGDNQAAVLAGEGNPSDRIRVIVNGVDPHAYSAAHDPVVHAELGVEGDTVVIGIVAELQPVKNHEMLLDASRILAARGADFRVVIVGDGPQRDILERGARDMGLSEHVVFLGWRTDVPRVLTGLDIVALTSTSEAFPLCLLEAMASERPVVATAVGDSARIVVDGETGFVVPSGDPEMLADRLAELIGDKDLRSRMGAAGASRMRDLYTRDLMLERYAALFEEIVDRHAPARGSSRD